MGYLRVKIKKKKSSTGTIRAKPGMDYTELQQKTLSKALNKEKSGEEKQRPMEYQMTQFEKKGC